MNFTNKEYKDARQKQMAVHQHYMANGWAKPVRKYSIKHPIVAGIKHPIVAAVIIFYVIGFLLGYAVGKS